MYYSVFILIDDLALDVNIEFFAGELKKKDVEYDENNNKYEHMEQILSTAGFKSCVLCYTLYYHNDTLHLQLIYHSIVMTIGLTAWI